MSSNSSSQLAPSENMILKPFYRLPILIISLGLLLLPLPINPWPSIIISSFGLFLLIQSLILRVEFTSDDLVVLQMGRELRRFPFKSWIAWRLLLPNLPGLLYFREEASPHLLPIIFDPKELENQLKLKVGSLQCPKKDI